MQAEATDSALREGIEAMGVKDSEKAAADNDEEGTAEQQETEMTAATEEEDSAAKEEEGTSFRNLIINNPQNSETTKTFCQKK